MQKRKFSCTNNKQTYYTWAYSQEQAWVFFKKRFLRDFGKYEIKNLKEEIDRISK